MDTFTTVMCVLLIISIISLYICHCGMNHGLIILGFLDSIIHEQEYLERVHNIKYSFGLEPSKFQSLRYEIAVWFFICSFKEESFNHIRKRLIWSSLIRPSFSQFLSVPDEKNKKMEDKHSIQTKAKGAKLYNELKGSIAPIFMEYCIPWFDDDFKKIYMYNDNPIINEDNLDLYIKRYNLEKVVLEREGDSLEEFISKTIKELV